MDQATPNTLVTVAANENAHYISTAIRIGTYGHEGNWTGSNLTEFALSLSKIKQLPTETLKEVVEIMSETVDCISERRQSESAALQQQQQPRLLLEDTQQLRGAKRFCEPTTVCTKRSRSLQLMGSSTRAVAAGAVVEDYPIPFRVFVCSIRITHFMDNKIPIVYPSNFGEYQAIFQRMPAPQESLDYVKADIPQLKESEKIIQSFADHEDGAISLIHPLGWLVEQGRKLSASSPYLQSVCYAHRLLSLMAQDILERHPILPIDIESMKMAFQPFVQGIQQQQQHLLEQESIVAPRTPVPSAKQDRQHDAPVSAGKRSVLIGDSRPGTPMFETFHEFDEEAQKLQDLLQANPFDDVLEDDGRGSVSTQADSSSNSSPSPSLRESKSSSAQEVAAKLAGLKAMLASVDVDDD